MKHFTLSLLLSLSLCTFGQTTDWYVNLHNIMDNREYKVAVGNPQSIMASRLDFAVGLKPDSTSGCYAGLNYMFEYGSNLDDIAPTLNLYYAIERPEFTLYAGSFAKEKVMTFPRIFFSDSLNYYTPNIGGLAYEWHPSWGRQSIYADWTGRRTTYRRESFILGIAGEYKKNNFYILDYAYMFHYGFRDGKPYSENIRDNGMGALFFGYDLSDKTVLNSLTCDLGFVGNYDRERPDDYHFYGGTLVRMSMRYKRLGIDATSYYGHKLHNPLGNQLYKHGKYTRIELCAIPLVGKNIETEFRWGLHFAKGILSNTQKLSLIAHF